MTDTKTYERDVNKVTLIGRLGGDPDIKTTISGKTFATLNLATSESWKNKTTGDWDKKTKWTRVTVWNSEAAELARTFRKGHRVEVNGKLEDSEWTTTDGEVRHGTQVTVNFPEGLKNASTGEGASVPKGTRKPEQKKQGPYYGPVGDDKPPF